MSKRIGLLLGSLIIGLMGCAGLKHLAKKPELSFKGLDVQGFSLNAATLAARFEVINPNSFDIKIDRIVYGLKLNGRELTAGEMSEQIKVEGRETSVVAIPFKLKYVDIVRTFRELAQNKSTSFLLNGTVKSGPFELPFEEKGELELPFPVD